MTNLDDLLRTHGRLTTVHVERWVERGLLRPSAEGDAYVEIHVDPHPFFEPHDNDIHVELPVTLTEAVLGGRIRVPTVGGPVMLNVPPGSNTGTSLRLKGRGLLDRKSGQRGDQYVKLKVVLPDKPDPALKEFVEKWEAGRAYDPRKAMEQFT